MTDAKQKEHVLTAVCMSPFRTVQRSFRHLSGGGFGLVATLLTSYCAMLSVEAIYVATPGFIGDERREPASMRFVPKPYVDDGARFGRVFPVAFNAGFAGSVMNPLVDVKSPIKWNTGNIWSNPGVLFLSLLAAFTIQKFESMVLRRQSFETTKRTFDAANAKKKVHADKNSVAEAKLREKQVNNHGSTGLLIKTVGVVGVYSIETLCFVASFGGSGAAVNIVYFLLTVFGFEIFDFMAEVEDL